MFATGRQRRGAPDAMLLLLLAQLYSTIERLPIKPPVTLGLAAANVLAHVRPDLTPPLARMCLAPSRVLAALRRGHGDFNGEVPLRLLGSAFVHADDFHLYYNMASLLWKGCSLEQRLGPQLFLELTVVVLALSSVLAVALNCAFDRAGLHMLGSINSCHVGFSGVLFAYKYILNHDAPGETRVHHIFRVATRHATWLELALISALSPRASFAGHLAGIVAGAVYAHAPAALEAAAARARRALFGGGERYAYRAAPTGRRAEPAAPAQPAAAREPTPGPRASPAPQARYQYRAEATGHAAPAPTTAQQPDAAELRRRRLSRLDANG